MSFAAMLNKIEASLRVKIRFYQKRAQNIELYLSKNPKEWGRFQSEFNAAVNGIFRDIMHFEKTNLANGNEIKVYKLKKIFINKFRPIFNRGTYCKWTIRKPYGYAGDFKIIDDIYQNNPATLGYDRLFDNYFQMSSPAIAVRNRKEDFKRLLADFINEKKNKKLRIMDLGSGPCRDLKELLCANSGSFKKTIFDCYDNDKRALNFGKQILRKYKNVNFFQENAVRLALKKDITASMGKKYSCIFSAGLLDYFNEKIAIKLIRNLKKLLSPDGRMFVANMRDKYCSPSTFFLEWGGDWNLVYRGEEEFKKIFIDAGFKEDQIKIQYEQQGIMQYIIIN